MNKQVGVQPGTSATSVKSAELDNNVKVISEAIESYLKRAGNDTLIYERGHSNAGKRATAVERNRLPELAHLGDTIGAVPDGGMWFVKQSDGSRRLLAAFEAKYQGRTGNAYERWNKNYMICEYINPALVYVTFMTGEGARDGNVLHSFGTTMSKIKPDTTIFYYAPDGLTQEEIFGYFKRHLGLSINFQDIQPDLTEVVNRFTKQKNYFNKYKQKKLAQAVTNTNNVLV